MKPRGWPPQCQGLLLSLNSSYYVHYKGAKFQYLLNNWIWLKYLVQCRFLTRPVSKACISECMPVFLIPSGVASDYLPWLRDLLAGTNSVLESVIRASASIWTFKCLNLWRRNSKPLEYIFKLPSLTLPICIKSFHQAIYGLFEVLCTWYLIILMCIRIHPQQTDYLA